MFSRRTCHGTWKSVFDGTDANYLIHGKKSKLSKFEDDNYKTVHGMRSFLENLTLFSKIFSVHLLHTYYLYFSIEN